MPTTLAVNLDLAFDRLRDFAAVNPGLNAATDPAPILRLQQAAGVGDDERERMRERIAELGATGDRSGAVALGIIVGLLAAQFAGESA